jgi:hypothetical protein
MASSHFVDDVVQNGHFATHGIPVAGGLTVNFSELKR